jgi:hypothetical protein
MQKCVRAEDREHEPEKDSDDENGVFHECLLVIRSTQVNRLEARRVNLRSR